MIDKNTYLRDPATTLTASENNTGVETGVDLVPQTWMLAIPITPTGTTPTLLMELQESDDNSNWRTLGTFTQDGAAINTINVQGLFYIAVQSNAKYRRTKSTVTGTTPSFGNAFVCPVPAGRYKSW